MSRKTKKLKQGKPATAYVVSDNEEGDVIGSNLHHDEIDDYYNQADEELSIKLNALSRRKNFDDVNEVFGMSDSDEDFVDTHLKKKKKKKFEDLEAGDEFDAEEVQGPWGRKKKNFYGGNPNDDFHPKKSKKKVDVNEDDSQELNEAETEEKEGRFLQEKQLQNLTDEDFLFDIYSGEGSKKAKKLTQVDEDHLDSVKLDLTKLTRREKIQLFARESPEFVSILEDFDTKMKQVSDIYQPIVNLIQDGILPSEGPAAEYIKLKHQITVNYGINITCYLMFKSKKVDLKLHPLTARLVHYKTLLDQMDEKLEPVVGPQIKKILAVLSKGGGITKLKKMVKNEAATADVKRLKKPKKKLKILQKEFTAEESHLLANNSEQHLTKDEAMALDLYQAMKKKSSLENDSDNSGSEEENVAFKDDEVSESKSEDESQRRSITYEMAKNKGLMPKRSKLQRNPRVKHRHKFEKAKIRRKGQVREVRKETKKYAGEISGINKRVKKGIKLA